MPPQRHGQRHQAGRISLKAGSRLPSVQAREDIENRGVDQRAARARLPVRPTMAALPEGLDRSTAQRLADRSNARASPVRSLDHLGPKVGDRAPRRPRVTDHRGRHPAHHRRRPGGQAPAQRSSGSGERRSNTRSTMTATGGEPRHDLLGRQLRLRIALRLRQPVVHGQQARPARHAARQCFLQQGLHTQECR